MGPAWTLKLFEFFNPKLLEMLQKRNHLVADSDDDNSNDNMLKSSIECWFSDQSRLICAYLAMDSLSNSLNIINSNHQNMIGITIKDILPSAGFWIARNGPQDLVSINI
jgi:hypothetical protein